MASRVNKRKSNIKILIIILAIILVILTIILISFKIANKSKEQRPYEEVNAEVQEIKENATLEKLYEMNEQERINYYCATFFKLIDNENFEEAYALLYQEYKDNYFPTLASFKKYFKDYFPDDMSLTFTNIERLGDIYVIWVNINDTLNGSVLGHNFELNVVIQENNYNDYVLSFSRDSAVNSM